MHAPLICDVPLFSFHLILIIPFFKYAQVNISRILELRPGTTDRMATLRSIFDIQYFLLKMLLLSQHFYYLWVY